MSAPAKAKVRRYRAIVRAAIPEAPGVDAASFARTESAFAAFGGVPRDVLLDNARVLIR